MSILPQGAIINETFIKSSTSQPSKTYKIDFEKGRIVGFTNDIEALKQAVYLILNTERFEHVIYSFNYGSELKGTIGNDKLIAESELKRRIKEALTQDDRIENVDNFTFRYDEDSVTIGFTVFSVFGDFNEKVVV
jgi:hypothetical protein